MVEEQASSECHGTEMLGNAPPPVEHLQQPPTLRKHIRCGFGAVLVCVPDTYKTLTRSVRDFQLHLAFPCPARLCTQAAPSLKYPSTGLSLTLGGVVHSTVAQPRLPPLSIGWVWVYVLSRVAPLHWNVSLQSRRGFAPLPALRGPLLWPVYPSALWHRKN